MTEKNYNKLSIGCFILGQIALLSTLIIPFEIGLILAFLSVGLGANALDSIKKKKQSGKIFAVIGVILSGISIILWVVFKIFI